MNFNEKTQTQKMYNKLAISNPLTHRPRTSEQLRERDAKYHSTPAELLPIKKILEENAIKVIGELRKMTSLKFGGFIVEDVYYGISTAFYKVEVLETTTKISVGRFIRGKFRKSSIINP